MSVGKPNTFSQANPVHKRTDNTVWGLLFILILKKLEHLNKFQAIIFNVAYEQGNNQDMDSLTLINPAKV